MTKYTSSEIEHFVSRAEDLFRQGFNCSQSVFAACAPALYHMDEDTALRLSASFGGGIGRMRSVCGAASGMFLLAGLENGSSLAGDANGKQQNYAFVQSLASAFRQQNGSLICAELLGLAPLSSQPAPEVGNSTQPSQRTEEYYHKRPCVEMVKSAVRIYLEQRSTIE